MKLKTTQKLKLARKMLTPEERQRGITPYASLWWRERLATVLFKEAKRNKNVTILK